jgi:hypothetical protein
VEQWPPSKADAQSSAAGASLRTSGVVAPSAPEPESGGLAAVEPPHAARSATAIATGPNVFFFFGSENGDRMAPRSQSKHDATRAPLLSAHPPETRLCPSVPLAQPASHRLRWRRDFPRHGRSKKSTGGAGRNRALGC